MKLKLSASADSARVKPPVRRRKPHARADAMAKNHRTALLFTGEDFAKTDVRSVAGMR
jgi:hypothetical protein